MTTLRWMGILFVLVVLSLAPSRAVKDDPEPFTVAVMAGTASNVGEAYKKDARELGVYIAKEGWALMYGAADFGLMGDLAYAYQLAEGPRLRPITTAHFYENPLYNSAFTRPASAYEVPQDFLDRLRLFMTAQAIFVLPGGLGTLGEASIFSALAQIDEKDAQGVPLKEKPLILINTSGFWDTYLAHLSHAVREGFVSPNHLGLLKVAPTPKAAIPMASNHQAQTHEENRWWEETK